MTKEQAMRFDEADAWLALQCNSRARDAGARIRAAAKDILGDDLPTPGTAKHSHLPATILRAKYADGLTRKGYELAQSVGTPYGWAEVSLPDGPGWRFAPIHPMTCCKGPFVAEAHNRVLDADQISDLERQYPRLRGDQILREKITYVRCLRCGTAEYRVENETGFIEVAGN